MVEKNKAAKGKRAARRRAQSSSLKAYRKDVSAVASKLKVTALELCEDNRLTAKIALWDASKILDKEMREMST